ncbi:sushi, von Willebrand factor type A, EGF and pentraxin domain-containing protein 1-like [Aplysia californica]|uniref:Sushi, von Willebrand factor type A, EGF and pentraxin domain-containing protein 1-like n=1 Tax=Aplysia californica TaxID=6500 RepID=A0ABM1A0F1_APLCA|nr:sushi, von Willebrand factor type A, EGF and pentraxin domain-containing protein 1-like [Aplysia californica]
MTFATDIIELVNHSVAENSDKANPNTRAVAEYKCFEGHVVPGTTNIVHTSSCSVDEGGWNMNIIGCLPIDCGEPPFVEHAVVDITGTTYESTASYSCESPLFAIGFLNSSTCSSSGNWTVTTISGTTQKTLKIPESIPIGNTSVFVVKPNSLALSEVDITYE